MDPLETGLMRKYRTQVKVAYSSAPLDTPSVPRLLVGSGTECSIHYATIHPTVLVDEVMQDFYHQQ